MAGCAIFNWNGHHFQKLESVYLAIVYTDNLILWTLFELVQTFIQRSRDELGNC